MKHRFIIAGLGNRGLGCFAKGISGFEYKSHPEFTEVGELAALVDLNTTRRQLAARELDRGETCRECKIAADCRHRFDMDIWDGIYRRLYAEAEHEDGYVRDRCVFSDRHTICDEEILNIRYAGGTLLSFSLLTYAPQEYWYFSFTGTKRRIEIGTSGANREHYGRIIKEDGRVVTTDETGKDYPPLPPQADLAAP